MTNQGEVASTTDHDLIVQSGDPYTKNTRGDMLKSEEQSQESALNNKFMKTKTVDFEPKSVTSRGVSAETETDESNSES